MKIGSLFSGIGGLELGLERAGVGHTVWQVEKEPFCREVLARHWPDATRYEDVTDVDWSEVERVDVICGGFPCQDISVAGRGAGLAGDRSGLWWEFARAIRDVRPSYVVVENVAALLVRGLGDVLGELAALGFDAEWDCIPAAAVGAPHLRDRLFILAYAQRLGVRLEPESEPWSSRQAVVADDGTQGPVADAEEQPVGAGLRESESGGLGRGRSGDGGGQGDVANANSLGRGASRPDDAHERPHALAQPAGEHPRSADWATEPDVGRVADGVPARVDRLRALGNAVVPQVGEVAGRRLMARRDATAIPEKEHTLSETQIHEGLPG